jgi:cell division septum initiation protein DivIVA
MSETPSFRSVLRGYDPAQVDQWRGQHAQALEQARQEAAERTVEVTGLKSALARAQEDHDRTRKALESAQEQQRQASAPTFAGLGERIGTILTLADEEASEIRRNAQADAQTLAGTSRLAADQARVDADRYAENVRTKAEAEATQLVEKARQQADALLDDADREAAARREEAEAYYEHQRARAAASAADFESTLGERRDKAAAEFNTQMSGHEQALAQAQERAAALAAEGEKTHATAKAESSKLLESARAEAESLVAEARDKAERIRRDSERELTAATARRDSITAQLSNVRQMLATLGGASMVEGLVEEPKSPSAQPKDEQAERPKGAAKPQEQKDQKAQGKAHDDKGQGDKAQGDKAQGDKAQGDKSQQQPAKDTQGQPKPQQQADDTSQQQAQKQPSRT